jgi:hypothetical protein
LAARRPNAKNRQKNGAFKSIEDVREAGATFGKRCGVTEE